MAFLWFSVLFSHFLASSCYVLDTSSVVPTHIFVHNNFKSISTGRWGEARRMKMSEGYIAYFSSDQGERSLEYVCANTSAQCQFQTDVLHTEKGSTEVSAWASIILPVVGMAGRLKFCSAPPHMFKQQPLVSPSEIDCSPWPSLEGYVIYPNSEVQETCTLEVYTWFMSRSNYREMRTKGVTEVFVPLFQKSWELPLYAAFNTMLAADTPSCLVKGPHRTADWTKLNRTEIIHQAYKFKYSVKAAARNSGEYAFKCSGKNWDEPNQTARAVDINKTLKITFIQGPEITLGGGGNLVSFPSSNMSGSFLLHIYSTSPITSITVLHSSSAEQSTTNEEQFLIEKRYSSTYDILSEYKIGVPWLTHELNGDYQIKVINEDRESGLLDIRITKAQDLKVLVSPTHISVGVGVAISFECLATGNLIQSVSWRRDFESIQNGKYSVEVSEFGSGEKRGVRLTLLKPRLEDSGHYECTASNEFETSRRTVHLSVWLPGSPDIHPNYQPDEAASKNYAVINAGAHVLNITDKEILQEYGRHHTRETKKSLATFATAGVVGTLVSVAVMGVVTAVLVCGCLWYRKRSQSTAQRLKDKPEEGEDSGGYPCDDEELGLEEGDIIGQVPHDSHNLDVVVDDDIITFDDDLEKDDENIEESFVDEGDGQEDDDVMFVNASEEVMAPLLGEEEAPRKKDKKRKRRDRDRADESVKGADKKKKKKREKVKGEREIGEGRKSRRERGDRSPKKDYRETAPSDKDKHTDFAMQRDSQRSDKSDPYEKKRQSTKRRSKGQPVAQ